MKHVRNITGNFDLMENQFWHFSVSTLFSYLKRQTSERERERSKIIKDEDRMFPVEWKFKKLLYRAKIIQKSVVMCFGCLFHFPNWFLSCSVRFEITQFAVSDGPPILEKSCDYFKQVFYVRTFLPLWLCCNLPLFNLQHPWSIGFLNPQGSNNLYELFMFFYNCRLAAP